jgi:photosystem II stability/assembly factor-like uncharacterized protein
MDKHQDFLEEEVEEQNQPLVRLLHDVYKPGQQDVRSLARMRERLFSGDSQTRNALQKTLSVRQNQNNLSNQQKHTERTGFMNSPISTRKTSRSQQWRRSLAILAAVLIVALVIGSLVITLNLIHRPSVSTQPTPALIPSAAASSVARTPTSVPLPHTPTQVQSIHMVNSATGWITCVDGSILRTTDGGLNWLDVTPPALLALQPHHMAAGSLFPDGSTAWIVVTGVMNATSAYNLQPFVFHTSDAGRSWQEGTLPKNESDVTTGPDYKIASISSQEAWVLDTHSAGMAGGPTGGERYGIIGLYHTTNSGKTWIQALNAPRGGQYNYVPAISFANQQTGIVTGGSTTSQPSGGVVYLTQDSGTSWKSIPMQSPDPAHWTLTALLSPQFSTPNDGAFTAAFHATATEGVTGVPAGQGFSVFSTHDGGQTWTSSPIVNVGVVGGATDTRFFNALQGYTLAFIGQVGQLALYTTSDGGQHWNSTALKLPDQTPTYRAGLPDFTSLTTGWTLLAYQSGTQVYPTSLYTTVDGGQTWTRIHAHFPSFITPQPAS